LVVVEVGLVRNAVVAHVSLVEVAAAVVMAVVVEVEVNLRPTVSRPVCLRVGIPSGTHDQISFISLAIAGLLIWGTISDERMGL
jgi:hypothetical protein